MLTRQDTESILHKQEIMYVDDERGVREGWKRFLSADDREVTTASDGDRAIQGLTGHPVDLVISDLRMPGADGLELLEWIRNNEPETRFILVTGFGGPEVEERARELGAFGYLEKPVVPDELEEIALAALRGEQSSWAHAVVADDPALASEIAAPVIEEAVAVEEVAAVEATETEPGTLRELVRLMLSPLVGLVYIMFLPVIGIAAAIYAIGMALAKALRPAVETAVNAFAEASAEPAIEETPAEVGTVRELVRLMLSPLVGLVYIMFLPVIGIAAAIYGIGLALAKVLRPVVESGIESVVFGAENEEPVVEPTPIEPGSLRDFGRLVAAPFKGLAYIVCLPVITIAVVAYGIGVRIVRIFRPASIR